MAGYVEQTLAPDERVLLRGRLTLANAWFWFFIAALIVSDGVAAWAGGHPIVGFTLIFMAVGGLVVPPILRCLTNELALTNKRVISRVGVLTISTTELRIEKIERAKAT